MATSVFFNNFQSSQEQLLIENLMIEAIKIYGHDVYYCPRTLDTPDALYGGSPNVSYNNAFFVEMYIKDNKGFKGQGDFMSKFGLQIRDEMTFTIARRIFSEEVGMHNELIRPLEGDIIYFPLVKKIFVIKFVEHESIFYQMGSLQVWDLQTELFEYSGEQLNTGIPEIDEIQEKYSTDMAVYEFKTEDGLVLVDEDGYPLVQEEYNSQTQGGGDNDDINNELITGDVIDWTELDPFSEGRY